VGTGDSGNRPQGGSWCLWWVPEWRETMGYMAARDMAAVGDDLGVSLEQQIGWHLTVNHFPPPPKSMVKPCVRAVKLYGRGEQDREVDLPSPVTWRTRSSAPAWALVRDFHLEPFLDVEY